MAGIKMGIRFNSGAIPVAVILMQHVALYFQNLYTTVQGPEWEGV